MVAAWCRARRTQQEGDIGMAVGLHLTGHFRPGGAGPAPEEWLDQAAAWLEGHEEEPLMLCRRGENAAGQPTLFLQIHPNAEDVELMVPAVGQLVVSARTSSLGPGYHIFLCHLLHRLGRQFKVAWEEPGAADATGDETGYFFTRDAAAVRTEMLNWLSVLARIVAENTLPHAAEVRMVSMPLGYSYPDARGVVTPLGPRSTDWFRSIAAEPSCGVVFFPWWEEGAGAAFFRGRALTRMWQDVRWRIPITDDEAELLMDVHLDLERAFRRAPVTPLPWREWHEIVTYLHDYFGYVEFMEGEDFEEEIQQRAAALPAEGPRIGYRRGRVQVSLTGGWSLTIPGELAEEWEQGGQTWSAWYLGRIIRFSSWSVQGSEKGERPVDEILPELELPPAEELYETSEGPVRGRAVFVACQEDGLSAWNLRAYSAVDGGFALCNIYVHGREDLPWALDVWKTLRH
jgi:hypothetical protein